MGERYLNIINISLILSTLYCSYSYVNLDKSTRQKNINYILTLNLIYNIIGILNINLDKKPIYMLASTKMVAAYKPGEGTSPETELPGSCNF